jgi:hypothetical protein
LEFPTCEQQDTSDGDVLGFDRAMSKEMDNTTQRVVKSKLNYPQTIIHTAWPLKGYAEVLPVALITQSTGTVFLVD